MVMEYIYLHGFASSPRSTKARQLGDRFRSVGIPLQTPDLNQGDFSHLTLSRQICQVEALLPEAPVTVIGSSFGGLTAAWIAQRQSQVERVVLLAPAFEFLDHWLPRLGEAQVAQWERDQFLSVYHYGEARLLPLHYDFVRDAREYREAQLQRSLPTLILHGIHDEVIPLAASQTYSETRPWVRLIALESDHALADVSDRLWQEISAFCGLESGKDGKPRD